MDVVYLVALVLFHAHLLLVQLALQAVFQLAQLEQLLLLLVRLEQQLFVLLLVKFVLVGRYHRLVDHALFLELLHEKGADYLAHGLLDCRYLPLALGGLFGQERHLQDYLLLVLLFAWGRQARLGTLLAGILGSSQHDLRPSISWNRIGGYLGPG